MARARRVTPTAGPSANRKASALPKGARRTTPSPETLAALGPDRLIGLILGETGRNPAFKKLVTAALASLQGPEAVAAIIDRRLTALEGAQGYIDWQKRRTFAADLNTTVTVILNELRPLDPGAALDRLRRFLDGADAVLNRVDDSTGAVQGVFDRAAAAFVEIAGALPPEDAAGLAMRLVEPFTADPFGPLGVVLGDMIPSLPEPALAEIDERLAAAEAAMPKGVDLRREATHHRQAARVQILRLRQAIADRHGDPDAFIALEQAMLPGREDRVGIARRLLRADRAGEALDWIRRMQDPGLRIATRADLIAGFDLRGPERERQALEIEILDALGRSDEAQAMRWARFERELDVPMLRTYLAKLPDFEDEEALQRALDHVEAFPQPHRALAFLAAWPDPRRAAGLVVARPGIWQGDQFATLAPVAEALAQDHPRAATILYRCLLDTILENGRSAAYSHGARYLTELEALAGRLVPGDVTPDPETYQKALRAAHGRKHAFWSLVRD
ncbi:hypothetical protein CIW48_01515 [Methylobacterium sp. P1-11]|uniref:DUF6880 family protein n=1 Tax=Methylobacterium sp. P1-11 TaxID=2024616 RepID=UPI0011ED0CFE|nr:DUF6880 family protein [Methylobacterium sp. P1-11]KAA0125806.1 hypothetical protein CIW48_01515 [Methylobacterium sp. P1-11]